MLASGPCPLECAKYKYRMFPSRRFPCKVTYPELAPLNLYEQGFQCQAILQNSSAFLKNMNSNPEEELHLSFYFSFICSWGLQFQRWKFTKIKSILSESNCKMISSCPAPFPLQWSGFAFLQIIFAIGLTPASAEKNSNAVHQSKESKIRNG